MPWDPFWQYVWTDIPDLLALVLNQGSPGREELDESMRFSREES